MKLTKLFFTALAILFAQQVYAQSSPYFTGGYIDVYSSKTVNKEVSTSQNTSDYSSSRYSASIFLGKRLSEHWRAGISLQADYIKQKSLVFHFFYIPDSIGISGRITSKTQNFGLGIFAYYLINPDNQLVFYLYPTVKYAKSKRKVNSNSSPDETIHKGFTTTGALRLGALYRLSPRWELFANVASIYFSHSSTREILQSGEKSDPIITNQLSGTFFPANIQLGALFHF